MRDLLLTFAGCWLAMYSYDKYQAYKYKVTLTEQAQNDEN